MASARALRFGKAVIELSLLTGDVEKNLKRVQQGIRDTGKAISSIGSTGLKFSAAIITPLLGAAKLAADAQEEMSKFKSVFGDQTTAANEFADALAGSIGRSAGDIRSGMNAFQGFFVGLGFANGEARELTEKMQSLSHDFAAFHNLTDEEAMERFISALSGSSEVLDKFGVNTRQAALEQELMERGIKKSWTAVTEQEKAIARLDVIMEAMTDQGAVGAAVRESGSFANQLKKLQGQMKDMGIAIGSAVLPHVVEFIEKTNEVAANVGEWIEQNKTSFDTTLKVAGVLGVASLAMIGFGSALSAAALVLNPFGLAVGALVGSYFALDKIIDSTNSKILKQVGAFDLLLPQLALLRKMVPEGWLPDISSLMPKEEVKGGSPNSLMMGGAMMLAMPDVSKRIQSGVSFGSGGFDIGAFGSSLVSKGMNAANTAMLDAQAATSGIPVWANGMQMHLDRAKDILAEQQQVDDEIARGKLQAMEDGIAKEEALIKLETDIRMRDLQARGYLTDELRGKLLELQGIEIGNIDDKIGKNEAMQAVATFDARFSRQMYGGRQIDEQTRLQRQMVAELKKQNRNGGGIPVVP
ncbi:hypothetical protein [Lacipirellula sp.]|uniref:hypothetical protein n=1 Tax=Lacipirellula sp. TaxID=2691419 RepID=UPI003D0B6C89